MSIYVLTCDRWSGTNYFTDVVEAFRTLNNAECARIVYQGSQSKCDIEYEITEVDLLE